MDGRLIGRSAKWTAGFSKSRNFEEQKQFSWKQSAWLLFKVAMAMATAMAMAMAMPMARPRPRTSKTSGKHVKTHISIWNQAQDINKLRETHKNKYFHMEDASN